MSTMLTPPASAREQSELSPGPPPVLTPGLTLLLASACGLIAGNLYYGQPLAGPIGAALGLPPRDAGLIVTMTQLGYGAGLLLIVPLADLLENRRLVLGCLGAAALALLAAAACTQAAGFLAAAMFIGVGSVAVQVLVPYAAHLAPAAVRGRAVGTVMSGLMLGIMLSRPAAGFLAQALSWRAVFGFAAGLMAIVALVLGLALPRRQPPPGLRYGALLRSMGRLALHTPVLQRRAFYHACLFGAFSLFWTTVPLFLAGRYHLTQNGIALFALVGVAGAVAAPLAGRAGDLGWSKPATGFAMLAAAGALLLSRWGVGGSRAGLACLAASAIVLDFGVTANLVLGQRAIYSLGAELRGRLNGLYMATFFMGGALGSAAGGWAYAHGGWSLSVWVGLALPMIALASFATEA